MAKAKATAAANKEDYSDIIAEEEAKRKRKRGGGVGGNSKRAKRDFEDNFKF